MHNRILTIKGRMQSQDVTKRDLFSRHNTPTLVGFGVYVSIYIVGVV